MKMANKTISKAILGLMTVMLLLVTIVPVPSGAAIDGTALLETTFRVVDDDAATVSFRFHTDAGAEANDPQFIVIEGNEVKSFNVDEVHGTQTVSVTLKELRDAGVVPAVGTSSDAYTLEIYEDTPVANGIWDPADVAVNGADGNPFTDEIWIEVVDDLDFTTIENKNDGTDDFNPIGDYEIRNQDGDRKIYSGDTIVLTLELEGDTRYQDMTVSARAKDGTNSWVQSEWVEYDTVFTLNEDKDRDVVLELEVADYVYEGAKAYDLIVQLESDYINLKTTYEFDIELEEDSLSVRSVGVSDSTVDAGDSIVVNARVANDGEDEQEDVTITAAIEDLGLSVTDSYSIGDLQSGDSESWSIVMAIPGDADAGTYELEITTASKNAEDSETIEIEVLGDAADTTNLDLDVVGEDTAALNADGTTTFTFEIENAGEERQVIELRVEGADAELSQSIMTVSAGETETFTVTVKEAGDVTVFAEADGELVYEDVTATSEDTAAKEEVIQVLQWIFAVIIIIAIILVIVWAVTKGRRNEDGKAEAYY